MELTIYSVWQDYKKERKLTTSTITLYEYSLRHCVSDWLYIPMASLSGNDIYRKHAELSANSPTQADLVFRVIRALYRFAHAYYEDDNGNSLMSKNPVQKLSGMRAWNGLKRRTGRIPPEKAHIWWQALEDLPESVRDMLKLLYLTGMRKNEASTLQWSDVNFEDGIFVLRKTKNGSDHILPMSSYVRDLFAERQKSAYGPYVFIGHYIDTPLSKNDRTYQKVVEATGIKFAPHDLRRGFMSTGAELGLQVYTIKKLLNHSNTDVTYGYYVADMNKLRESLQLIDDELMRHACPQAVA